MQGFVLLPEFFFSNKYQPTSLNQINLILNALPPGRPIDQFFWQSKSGKMKEKLAFVLIGPNMKTWNKDSRSRSNSTENCQKIAPGPFFCAQIHLKTNLLLMKINSWTRWYCLVHSQSWRECTHAHKYARPKHLWTNHNCSLARWCASMSKPWDHTWRSMTGLGSVSMRSRITSNNSAGAFYHTITRSPTQSNKNFYLHFPHSHRTLMAP